MKELQKLQTLRKNLTSIIAQLVTTQHGRHSSLQPAYVAIKIQRQ